MRSKILCQILITTLFLPFVSADIGYEILDNNHIHIWNDGGIKQDWYYTPCLSQISNTYLEPWEKVRWGITYGDNDSSRLNNVKYLDEFNGTQGCNLIFNSDNTSYVNISSYKRIEYGNKQAIIGKNSYIELNDDMMQESVYIRPLSSFNQELWLFNNRSQINIGYDFLYDDYFEVYNHSYSPEKYYLNSSTILFNQEEILPAISIGDESSENIRWYTNTSNNYKIWIKDDNIYYGENLGVIGQGETKGISSYWVDAGSCTCLGDIVQVLAGIGNISDGDIFYVDDEKYVKKYYEESFGIGGGFGCFGDWLELRDNSTGEWKAIPTTDTDIDSHGVTTRVNDPISGTDYWSIIDMEGAGMYDIYTHYECPNAYNLSSTTIDFEVIGEEAPKITIEPDSTSTSSNETYIWLNTTITDRNNLEHYSFLEIENDVIMYYTFDSSNSTGVFDNSSNSAYTDFTDNANVTPFVYGNGSTFDGVNDGLFLTETYNFTKNMTLNMWLNTSTAGILIFIGKIDADNFLSRYNTLRLRGQDSNNNWMEFNQVLMPVNQAMMLTIVNNGTHWKAYKNGTHIQNIGVLGDFLINAIGQGYLNNNYEWRGEIDEVLLINRTLNETEIQALYNNATALPSYYFSPVTEGNYSYTIYATNGLLRKKPYNIEVIFSHPLTEDLFPVAILSIAMLLGLVFYNRKL